MTNLIFKKIPLAQAASCCQDIELEPLAQKKLTLDVSPASFLEQLIAENLFSDAVRFLARALPKREATWWACLCTRDILVEPFPEALLQAVTVAEKWVYEPTEANRQATYAAAQSAEFNHPASWAAMAAFWSGGSLAPPDAPVVPPPDNLTGKAVASAVMLAAVLTEPERASDKYRLFLQRGIDIASGGNGRLQ